MVLYIHELPDWPVFRWDLGSLSTQLASVSYRQGRLLGRMESLGLRESENAELEANTLNIVKSSEIEGEVLDWSRVRSSVSRRLGIADAAVGSSDREIDGVVSMMLDATSDYAAPLTRERLFGWHASLFPAGYSGMKKLRVGAWRDDSEGPMQVVSGPVGRENVHYEAPAAKRIEKEMAAFLAWFDDRGESTHLVLRAALAHLWFVTIHPFEDGNGRIARALADLLLARSEESSRRFYSMSAQIRLERDDYYDRLERTQSASSGLDVTPWLEWFLGCLDRALQAAEETTEAVISRARLWESWTPASLNDRQRMVLTRFLDGFEGKLTSTKWSKLAKCSQDTAWRDIQVLLERGILGKDPAGGRSTSYSIKYLK
ncbi:MAG TPA: Fic family protein [Candidatus Deferrimicrobiaceae bacterium]|jgi:Fic family protein